MSETIFITGASSGIGKATAELFQAKGWNVVATMRNTDAGADLAKLENVLVTSLDVTKDDSIAEAVAAGTEKFGKIDVLLNNAGYGAYGPLEAFDIEGIRRQFDTNVIGLLSVTKALLPQMRANAAGTVINISSIGGQMTFPLGTLYHGTKFAVEGISEALHYELAAAGIKTKIVEPGMIATDFGGRSFDFQNDETLTEYQPVVKALFDTWGAAAAENASPASLVADVIWTAATDGSDTLRYRAGADAEMLLDARRSQDDTTFIAGIKAQLGLAGPSPSNPLSGTKSKAAHSGAAFLVPRSVTNSAVKAV